MSYALVCRGDNIRGLQLSEMGLMQFDDEGVRGARVLRTVWHKSKMNQYNHFEQTTCMRHREVTKCPIGALAFYFFHRWHVGHERWPDFSTRQGLSKIQMFVLQMF